ncbi:MAG: sugar ABC transporter ATP-binding protein, partial [Desulfamplus sp.]|nr:sugar ABC transporter ATP-binding protein [Desulfamplus sp.]
AGTLDKDDIKTEGMDHNGVIQKISRLMVGGSVVKTRRGNRGAREDRGTREDRSTRENRAKGAVYQNSPAINRKMRQTAVITTSDFRVDKPGDSLKGLDLTVHKGEILGITGLSGHGKNAIGAGIMGLHPAGGRLTLYGEDMILSVPRASTSGGTLALNKHSSSCRNRSQTMISKNVWLVPEDRSTLGLLLDHSIVDNITFAAIQNKKRFARKLSLPFSVPFIDKILSGSKMEFISSLLVFPDTRACIEYSCQCVRELDIKCSSVFQKAGELSGGNQQKVCIAAAVTMSPDILFVSEPTRGIDISGKEAILDLLLKAQENLGMTIIVSSGELDELRRICDRIAIIYQGRLFDIFTPDRSEEDFARAFSGLR